jgi:NAD/ferredoxin-dependent reductase-like protein
VERAIAQRDARSAGLGLVTLGFEHAADHLDQLAGLGGAGLLSQPLAFWLKDGRVVAGMNVNVWDVADQVKTLIRSRARVQPGRLADTGVSLAELAGVPASTAG